MAGGRPGQPLRHRQQSGQRSPNGEGPATEAASSQRRRRRPVSAYAEAALVLDKLDAREGSLRSLVHSDAVSRTRQVHALVCQVLKYRQILERVAGRSGLLESEERLRGRPNAALLVVYDLLIGGGVRGRGSWQTDVLRHQDRLHQEWANTLGDAGATTAEDLLPEHIRRPPWIPRWVRVNTLRCSIKQALKHLRRAGYEPAPAGTTLDDWAALDSASTPGPRWVHVDALLPEVLALPPSTDLSADALRAEGGIILQDMASCMPAYALGVDEHVAHVIDACAAPGNKTSCLAALMKNRGRITAFDLDARRLRLLVRMTKIAGATNIEPRHRSFLEVDPTAPEYADVSHILVDPSCSGSGIVHRIEDLVQRGSLLHGDIDGSLINAHKSASTADGVDGQTPGDAVEQLEEESHARLAALADFQCAAVVHATSFPSVRRICYSTCSVHPEENEMVVKAVLDAAPDFRLVTALEGWPRCVSDL